VESRIAWFDEHEPSSRPLWIVHSAAENIGWVSFQSFYGRPAYRHTSEISLYLEESSRHKGLGKIILEKVIESCPALKIKTLIGFIFAQNEPSMRLFSTMGFSIWGHLPGIAEFEGEERDVNI